MITRTVLALILTNLIIENSEMFARKNNNFTMKRNWTNSYYITKQETSCTNTVWWQNLLMLWYIYVRATRMYQVLFCLCSSIRDIWLHYRYTNWYTTNMQKILNCVFKKKSWHLVTANVTLVKCEEKSRWPEWGWRKKDKATISQNAWKLCFLILLNIIMHHARIA